MKKTLFSIVAFFGLTANAQTNLYSYNFDTAFPTTWANTNQSTPIGAGAWTKATYTTTSTATSGIFGSGIGNIPVGQAGGNNSFALVNYTSTTGTGTISNWLITSTVNVKDGDIVSFYTRKGTDGTTDYADRLELRYSSSTTHVNPTGGSAGLGSFTNVGVTVNPNLATGFIYPKVWTKYSFTIAGVGSTETSVKFAFRYFVTNGGPTGTNSDIIGIDTFSVDRPELAVSDVKNTPTSIYPNPAKDVLNFSTKVDYKSVKIYNLLGQLVIEKAFDKSLNVSALQKGSYIINLIKGDKTVDNIKFIKE